MRSLVCALALVVFGWPAAAPAQGQDPFAAIAEQLVRGVGAANPAPRVAVWEFGLDVPVPRDVAEGFNLRLESALVRAAQGRIDVKTRSSDAFLAIVRELTEFGARGVPRDNPIPELQRSNQLDVLVMGRMTADGPNAVLLYRAVRLDGSVVATAEGRVPIPTIQAAVPLANALLQAAEDLHRQTPGLTGLRLGGITFQDKGFAMPLGDHIQRQAVAALVGTNRNVLTERSVRVFDRDVALGAGEYALTGTYWDFGDSLELHLELRDASDKVALWSGRIRRDSLPQGMAVRPNSDFGPIAENPAGPVRFAIEGRTGRNPEYRIGEAIEFRLSLSRASWVHCFVVQGHDNAVKRLFPNAHYKDARVPANQTFSVGGWQFNFDIVAMAPAGTDLFKCFAADRDITNDLPAAWRDPGVETLPDGMHLRLHEVFRAIRNARITEASAVVTVRP